jgi:YidC/Oxa1 family membrane protein insertase
MSYGTSRSWLPSLALGAALFTACTGAESEPSASSGAGQPAPKPAASVPVDPSRTVVIESNDFRITVAEQNAAVAHVVMKDPRYERGGKQIDLVTTDKLPYLPLTLDIGGVALPADALWRAEKLSDRAVRLTLEAGDVTLVRKLEIGNGPFQLWSTLRVHNRAAQPKQVRVQVQGHHYARREDEEGGFLAARSPLSSGGICAGESVDRHERPDIVEDQPSVAGAFAFGSLDTVYFTQALAADKAKFERCELRGSDRGGNVDKPDGSLLSLALTYPKTDVPPGGDAVFRTLAYFGPKTQNELAAAGHGLTDATHVGGLPGVGSIAHGLVSLLAYIHDHVIGNWGLAIILLTLCVKLALYPLTAKSFQSIAAMRRLKPAIDELNEKYADDREKKGAAMMELYRKHKINPFGGCLPQLLQLPIWWALYTSLSTNVELFKRPFFGPWQDLTAPDPFYVLPLMLGVLMWIQQRMTPSTMDPAQAKMMLYVMPAMVTSFMLFLPAGLCVYMFTNQVLSIGQQRFIEYRLAHKQPAVAAPPVSSPDSPPGAAKDSTAPRRTRRGRA